MKPLYPCPRCGQAAAIADYCRTSFPCIHDWNCPSCGASGQCRCIGDHATPENWFGDVIDAMDGVRRRAVGDANKDATGDMIYLNSRVVKRADSPHAE